MPLAGLIRFFAPSLVPNRVKSPHTMPLEELDSMRGMDGYSLSIELRSPGHAKAPDAIIILVQNLLASDYSMHYRTSPYPIDACIRVSLSGEKS